MVSSQETSGDWLTMQRYNYDSAPPGKLFQYVSEKSLAVYRSAEVTHIACENLVEIIKAFNATEADLGVFSLWPPDLCPQLG